MWILHRYVLLPESSISNHDEYPIWFRALATSEFESSINHTFSLWALNADMSMKERVWMLLVNWECRSWYSSWWSVLAWHGPNKSSIHHFTAWIIWTTDLTMDAVQILLVKSHICGVLNIIKQLELVFWPSLATLCSNHPNIRNQQLFGTDFTWGWWESLVTRWYFAGPKSVWRCSDRSGTGCP